MEQLMHCGGATRLAVIARGLQVTIYVDGQPVTAYEGEMLASALLAAGILEIRKSPSANTSRGAFCFMGVCQECVVKVGGDTHQACLVTVREGLDVELSPPYEGCA